MARAGDFDPYFGKLFITIETNLTVTSLYTILVRISTQGLKNLLLGPQICPNAPNSQKSSAWLFDLEKSLAGHMES